MSVSQLGFERLFELERGLRSSNRQHQEKAFEDFEQYFLEYKDHPEAIEGGVLRIVDFFKARSLERKFEIVQGFALMVCRVGELIFSPGETVRRLSALWEVPDPLLRALVITMFRILAASLRSEPEIQYRVLQSIQSPHREEHIASLDAWLACWKHVPEADRSHLANCSCDSLLYRLESFPAESRYTKPILDALSGHLTDADESEVLQRFLERQLNIQSM